MNDVGRAHRECSSDLITNERDTHIARKHFARKGLRAQQQVQDVSECRHCQVAAPCLALD